MSAVINVLSSIGLIAIIAVIVYYVWNYFNNMYASSQLSKIRPTPTYMETVGLKCPDYWEYMNVDENGNYICKDKFGLIAKYGKSDDSQCAYKVTKDGVTDIFAKFSPYDSETKWGDSTDEDKIDFMKIAAEPDSNDTTNSRTFYSRSEWINSCGPFVGDGVSTKAVWSGLEKYA